MQSHLDALPAILRSAWLISRACAPTARAHAQPHTALLSAAVPGRARRPCLAGLSRETRHRPACVGNSQASRTRQSTCRASLPSMQGLIETGRKSHQAAVTKLQHENRRPLSCTGPSGAADSPNAPRLGRQHPAAPAWAD